MELDFGPIHDEIVLEKCDCVSVACWSHKKLNLYQERQWWVRLVIMFATEKCFKNFYAVKFVKSVKFAAFVKNVQSIENLIN